ncbi:hypothetical protein FHG87_010229 [Trinorchestia longiramus]|nr:hypothetical protein FHG87_010229 [Trinorchestia longiramus]
MFLCEVCVTAKFPFITPQKMEATPAGVTPTTTSESDANLGSTSFSLDLACPLPSNRQKYYRDAHCR